MLFNKIQGVRVELQVSGQGGGGVIGQGQDRDKILTRQGKDRDKTGI